MRLISVKATNFGSYNNLEFNLENQGLVLISGSTGSGKSTLLDVVSWVFYGTTAKDGNADDIRKWGSAETTTGEVVCEHGDTILRVNRIRGRPSDNDLYWTYSGSDEKHRGKDITESQILLEEVLKISSEAYHISAYYNEYSSTRRFFDSNAKQRRELFENLADLSFPALLTERITSVKRDTKKAHVKLSEGYNQAIGRLEQLRSQKANVERDAKRWSESQAKTIQDLSRKIEGFEREKASKIEALETKIQAWTDSHNRTLDDLISKVESLTQSSDAATCPTCGSVNHKEQKRLRDLDAYRSRLESASMQDNPFLGQLEQAKALTNTYSESLEAEKSKPNPFTGQHDSLAADAEKWAVKERDLKAQVAASNHKVHSLDHLSELSSSLRAELLKNAIKHVESETNRYLDTYFDAEIRVQFELEDSDSLAVTIWKSGFECSYRQLSKGQKCLLILCFSTSVMLTSANKSGVHFDTLMYDEALDGLDEDLKIKSFGLFSELSKDHSTILVIDHNSTFQSLFSKTYRVTLVNDQSVIEDANK